LNEGRAAPTDTTVKPPITLAGPLDEVVIRVGLASIVLGSVLVLTSYATDYEVGALGVVPGVFTGLQAISLGWIAIVLAHPTWGGPRPGRFGWLYLATGLVATVAVVIVALDEWGAPADAAPAVAGAIVGAGRGAIIGVLTWLFIVLVFAGVGFLWRQLIAPGVDRLIR
jgi:hypothetical protein